MWDRPSRTEVVLGWVTHNAHCCADSTGSSGRTRTPTRTRQSLLLAPLLLRVWRLGAAVVAAAAAVAAVDGADCMVDDPAL